MQRLFLILSTVYHWIHAFFSTDTRLHQARFSHLFELNTLLSPQPAEYGLLLGRRKSQQFLTVRPAQTRPELGNLLIVGPTRSGKGLLATSQLLSWQHSVIVNDIKGDLFTATAGYRSSLGDVYVLDPTGVGHAFDPLLGKNSEDELYSAASHLLFNPREGEGLIFTQRATAMLTQLFLAARLEKQAPLPSVRHIIRLGLAGAARRLN